MRPAPPLGGLALVLALGGHATAAPTTDKSYTATVTQDRTEVRCQPSTNEGCYVTNLLRRGDRVKVLGDAGGGWLKVDPPASSFSWINTRFIHQPYPHLGHWVVDNEAQVRIGSSVVEELPQVKGSDLQKGAIVYQFVRQGVLGRAQVDTEGNTGTWLPIVPPPGEVRYLRKETIAPTASTVLPPAPPGPTVPVAPSAQRTYPPLQTVDTAVAQPADPAALFWHAEQADRAGRTADAIGLYGRVVREGSTSHPSLAEQARARLYFLNAPGTHTPPPPQSATETLAIRGNVPGEVLYGPAPDGRLLRPLTDSDPPTPAVRLASPASTAAPEHAARPQGWTQPASVSERPAGTPGGQWQVVGTLRTSGRPVAGVRSFALQQSGPNGVLYYVVPTPGVDLDRYVGRKVEISGPAVYKGDLRANCIEALQVRPLP